MHRFKRLFILVLLCTTINMHNPVLSKTIEINAGLPVLVTFNTTISSKRIEMGQKINGVVLKDVIVDGVLVFKKGDGVLLNILDAKRAGFMGGAGEMHLVNGSLTPACGEKIPIECDQKICGKERNWPKVFLTAGFLFLPLGILGLVRGGEAKLTPDCTIEVKVRSGFCCAVEKL